MGGGSRAQLGQIAGSSRDVNNQATSTDLNRYLAGLGEEVNGIDGEEHGNSVRKEPELGIEPVTFLLVQHSIHPSSRSHFVCIGKITEGGGAALRSVG